MLKSILVAGFGGQGVQFTGRLLALAGMYSGKNVTHLPSYGPEMRGGTSNCCVNISDEEIGSPAISQLDMLIAMNQPALNKFAPIVKPGGVIVADDSMVVDKCAREDVSVVYIPATKLALDKELRGAANVIMVGRLIAETGLYTKDEIVNAMAKAVRPEFLEANKVALDTGVTYR
jgi:2-oxoglutarate ferredoxin oxidoreductase subunit gamma